MPICPKCGAVLKKGITTCSCGATSIASDDEKLDYLLTVDAKKVEMFQDLKSKCLEAYENKDYQKSYDYSTDALRIGIGSDAELSFARGKSLYHMNRFLDSINSFDRYLKQYKNSFYRFANISGAYEWKAAALWQLGNGFEAIKCYYAALENVDKQPCSIDEKMEMRSRIEDARIMVMRESAGKGAANPRIGTIEGKVYNRLESLNPDVNLTMQNLYDAINSVASEDCQFKSLILKDGDVYVEFSSSGETIEKCFDGTSTFK